MQAVSPPGVKIPHPGYDKSLLMRSATGSVQFRPDVVEEMLRKGQCVLLAEKEADRKEVADRFAREYEVSRDKIGEIRAAALYFGPSTQWTQSTITLLPWSVLRHLSRYKMDDELREQAMTCIVHYIEHPGCANTIQPRIDNVVWLVDHEPNKVRSIFCALEREKNGEPMEAPRTVPDAFSAAIHQQVQKALEAALAALQSDFQTERERLRAELEQEQERTRGLERRVAELTTWNENQAEQIRKVREELSQANLEISARSIEVNREEERRAAVESNLSEAARQLRTLQRAVSDIVIAFRHMNGFIGQLAEMEGVSALVQDTHNGNHKGVLFIE